MIDQYSIGTASRVDLAAYLISRGECLKKAGHGFVMANHDSLRFYKNTFHWYSRGIKGNSINFLCLYYRMTFPEAVGELNRYCGFSSIGFQDVNRVIAYLCKKRRLDYQLVNSLIRRGMIYQDEKGNCNFVVTDWNGHTIGAEIVGTGNTRYKQITFQGSHGFHFTVGEPTDVLFFESAIDLLSCYQMFRKKFTHHAFISMGGLKPSVVDTVLSFGDNLIPWLCVDNDKGGNDFINHFSTLNVFRPKGFKDWNDALRFNR